MSRSVRNSKMFSLFSSSPLRYSLRKIAKMSTLTSSYLDKTITCKSKKVLSEFENCYENVLKCEYIFSF